MDKKHTKTPYSKEVTDQGTDVYIVDANGERIAKLEGWNNDGHTADFIVRACNNFPDLATALEELLKSAPQPRLMLDAYVVALAKARKALEKAGANR